MRALQNDNSKNDFSAPFTPEALRRQNTKQTAHASTLTGFQHYGIHPENINVKNMKNQFVSGNSTPLPLKKEKMEFNERMMKMGTVEGRPLSYHGKSLCSSDNSCGVSNPTTSPLVISPLPLRRKREGNGTNHVTGRTKEVSPFHRMSMPVGKVLENRLRKFDLSDLDTNLPRIDLEAIETHLKVAGEDDTKQRRCDRDEIRRRLALESDDILEKSNGRKPSLHSRLQSSLNLQICFMNETASDSESPGSDTEATSNQQPGSLPINPKATTDGEWAGGRDFYIRQAKLQADACQALSQAKDLARIQMSHERERRRYSLITEMVRNSLQKVGMNLSPERRRFSRQLLTEMNVAQLQVIVNDLHNHIEDLNEKLVSMLLDRDELHMEQDSMLVDIEDLSRYLVANETSPHQSLPVIPKSLLLGRK